LRSFDELIEIIRFLVDIVEGPFLIAKEESPEMKAQLGFCLIASKPVQLTEELC
jgi:hypothetical protein